MFIKFRIEIRAVLSEIKHFIRYLRINRNDRCFSSPNLIHTVIKESIEYTNYKQPDNQYIKVADVYAKCRYCTKYIYSPACVTLKEERMATNDKIFSLRIFEAREKLIKKYGMVSCLE